MDKERKEIEEFANDLSIEFNDIELSDKDGIEHDFYLQQAKNLIKKGYRKSPPPEKEEWLYCNKHPQTIVIYDKGYGSCPKCVSTPTLQALDEEKVYKIMADTAEEHCGPMSEIGEEITRHQAKALCSTFGQSPMASEEELFKTISDVAVPVISKGIGIGTHWGAYKRNIAQAILKFLKERR